MYKASIYPNRISVRYVAPLPSVHSRWAQSLCKLKQSKINLSKSKSSWKLSYQSKKKFLDSCHFLNQASEPRTIKAGTKFIYNYQSSFITLTLPVNQFTSDLSIKQALNHFLTQLRQKFGLKNYVWKAELQKNQSIHFHIIIDIYIHHSAIRYYWNQAIEVLGYVSEYHKKYSKLSLRDYAELRGISIQEAIKPFRYGRDTNWQSPPTEQIKAVRNPSQLAGYLAKYIIKPLQAQEQSITEEEIERIISFGRFWGRSQSLSSIHYISHYCWESLKEFFSKSLSQLHKVSSDWCTNYYTTKHTSHQVLFWFRKKMMELGITYQYPFPV